MAIEILMPALSPTMNEGNLARWLKKEGDWVKTGDILAEIETDKATIELEAANEGKLSRILVPDGSNGVKVNQPIAVLVTDSDDAEGTAAAPVVTPEPASRNGKMPFESSYDPARKRAGDVIEAGTADRVFASPLARRRAKEGGIDLAAVSGSGPHGRIVWSDIEKALAVKKPMAVGAVAAVTPPSNSGPGFIEAPLSSVRKVIARRLSEAKQTVPHFYLTIDCLVDKLLALRAELNSRSEAYKLSVNDFLIRACAQGLKKVPTANASFTETAVRLFTDIDISVAVAIPDGLITPVIRHAERKGLAEISNEMKSLAARARDGKLKPEEYQGGSFSISNLGMYGVKQFEAIINPPQACILAVGASEQRPVVKNGGVGIATVMSCTLSVDHRAVDGATGAAFLAAFKALVEEPLTMLL